MTVEYLLNREIDRVLAVLTPGNALVVRAMLETGLRVGDVLNLRAGQLRNNFWVTEAKTGKRRHVGLTTALIDDIWTEARRYIPKWQTVMPHKDLYIFPSPTNWQKPRTRQAVWKDIKRAAAAFRMPRNVGTHTFRKVYAVELLAKYGSFARVQKALNHTDPSVTAIYAMADKLVTDGKMRRAFGGKRRR